MNVLVASLCCLLLASLAAGASLVQNNARPNLRITDGEDTEALPFLVALFKDGVLTCSGTILSTEWILTAASCVDGVSGELEVRAGLSSLTDNSANVQRRLTVAADRTVHPQFDQEFLDNDIALVKLTQPLAVDGSHVAAITLPTYAEAAKNLAAERYQIAGWGRTGDSDADGANQNLKVASVAMSANSVCEKEYGNKVIGTKLCLETAEQGRSPCTGDAGGPVFSLGSWMRADLHGIVSFGFEQGCQTGKPVVFTRVSSFLEWIEDATGIAIKD